MDFNTWKEVNENFSKKYNWDFEKQLEETWKEAQKETRAEIKSFQDEIEILHNRNDQLRNIVEDLYIKLGNMNNNLISSLSGKIDDLIDECNKVL